MTTVKVMCIEEHLHDVEGQWAATRAIKRDAACSVIPDRWVVTLVPSARCLASVFGMLSEQEAIAVASALDRDVPPIENWRKITPEVAWTIIGVARQAAPIPEVHDVD